MKRVALLAGAGGALLPTPALAMDEGAIIAMLAAMGASAVGVIGGGISGWLRGRFFSSLGWTFAAGFALLLVALLLPRGGFKLGQYLEAFAVSGMVAAIPLALAFSVAYGIAYLIAKNAKASE